MKDDMKIEMEAGRNIQLDHLKEFITNPQDCEAIMAYSFEDTKKIYKENKRLKAQLDREIKINRKMKSALEKYADLKNWSLYFTLKNIMKKKFFFEFDNYKSYELAKQVLKEIDNKE